MPQPYNPLDKINLGRSVAEALLKDAVRQLSDTADVSGAGIYAIYYTGDFPPYGAVANLNRQQSFEQPIYVGKAIPKGGRKGGVTFDAAAGKSMRDRLRQHAASIKETKNLKIEEFFFRSLTVDDIWIPLGENMMIAQFQPIWNRVIDGFGIKTPGAGRQKQRRSPWDVLHPGRAFAANLSEGALTPAEIEAKLNAYFAGGDVALVPEEEAGDDGDAE